MHRFRVQDLKLTCSPPAGAANDIAGEMPWTALCMREPTAWPGSSQIVGEIDGSISLPETNFQHSTSWTICENQACADILVIIFIERQVELTPNSDPTVGCWGGIIRNWQIHPSTKEPGSIRIAAAKFQLHGLDAHVLTMPPIHLTSI